MNPAKKLEIYGIISFYFVSIICFVLMRERERERERESCNYYIILNRLLKALNKYKSLLRSNILDSNIWYNFYAIWVRVYTIWLYYDILTVKGK